MEFLEVKENVFPFGKREGTPYYIQCVSRDLKMGAGIATQFNWRFNTKNIAEDEMSKVSNPHTIKVLKADKVFNLITKERYYLKPTYKTLSDSLIELVPLIKKCQENGELIEEIRMPLIGCGLDKLKWSKVRELIKDILVKGCPDIKFVACYLKEDELFK